MIAVRRLIDIVLAGLVVVVLAIGLAANLAPAADAQLLSIRGGSMEPAIPVGAMVVAVAQDPESLEQGDVVSVRLTAGTVVTHRIVGIVEQDDRRMFRLRGDANPSVDPVLVLPDQVIGRVDLTVPLLGFLLAMLSMPSGIAALVSIGAMLLTAGWLLDELEEAESESAEGGFDPAESKDPELEVGRGFA
jgi:signal peptidase